MKKYVILALLDGEKTTWLAMGKNKNEILKYFLDNYNKNDFIPLIIKRINKREYLLVRGLGGKNNVKGVQE